MCQDALLCMIHASSCVPILEVTSTLMKSSSLILFPTLPDLGFFRVAFLPSAYISEDSLESFDFPFPLEFIVYALLLLLRTIKYISFSAIIQLDSSKVRGVGMTNVVDVVNNHSNLGEITHRNLSVRSSNLSTISIITILYYRPLILIWKRTTTFPLANFFNYSRFWRLRILVGFVVLYLIHNNSHQSFKIPQDMMNRYREVS